MKRKNAAEFDELLAALREDLAPVGALEEILVEKIAVCQWRQNRALRWEATLTRLTVGNEAPTIYRAPQFRRPESEKANARLNLPLDDRLDRILRYETSSHRQLVYAINQLERIQRTRKGEHVPAPVNVQLSSDQ